MSGQGGLNPSYVYCVVDISGVDVDAQTDGNSLESMDVVLE